MSGSQNLRDRMAELDSAIRALDAQKSVLEAERRLVRKKLRSLDYPVLTLPAEITSEIFIRCLPPIPSGPTSRFPKNPSRRDAPLILLEICRAWREIAQTTPGLWASCEITDYVPSRAFALYSDKLSSWLSRAGLAPLSILLHHHHLDSPQTASDAPRPALSGLFRRIIESSAQWHHIQLRFPFLDLLDSSFQSVVEGNLPILESLDINVRNVIHARATRASGTVPITAFQHAPRLRAVSLTGVPSALIVLPWAQLTSLTSVHALTAAQCIDVLRLAVGLEECKLLGLGERLDQERLELLPPLPQLRSCSVICPGIFCVLTLPALTDLEVYHDIDFSVPFFTRSHPRSLRRFHVHEFAQHLIAGVPFMPALEEIWVDDMGEEQLAEVFAFLGDTATLELIPRLQSIHVTLADRSYMDDDAEKVDYEGIVDALCKMKEFTQLRSFRLDCLDPEEYGQHEKIYLRPHVHQRFLELREEGVEVYLGTNRVAWI
ncbi:hypothetical protein C8J57DRAFT_681821 [Mycena rebaudengoi]|nr:hypothetical protein C8J57DRAFT_681821 [Mycena rebaudengoi]